MTRPRALLSIHTAAVLFGLTGVFGALIQSGAAATTLGRAAFALLALRRCLPRRPRCACWAGRGC